MILKDTIPFGIALPHRSPDLIDIAAVRHVAQRADALGFRDLWVTENTLDHVFCFDSVVLLTYAAALTTTIRLGVSVMVLSIHQPIHVAHQIATLDYLSNGRAVLGVGLGRNHHYTQFQVPREQRVRRFRESVELIRALWTESEVNYQGSIFQLDGATMAPSRCRSHALRSGSAARTRTRFAGLQLSPTDGWAPAAQAWRPLPATSRF